MRARNESVSVSGSGLCSIKIHRVGESEANLISRRDPWAYHEIKGLWI